MKKNHTFIKAIVLITSCLNFFSCTNTKEEKENVSLFEKVPFSKSGVKFRNDVEEKFENYFDLFQYIYNGAGVAVGDINNDGLQDIYFVANEKANSLYLNKGDFQFEDITSSAGVEGLDGWHNGVSMVDINGDNFMDIYICRGGWQDTDEHRKNLLYINNGDLTFTEKAAEYGLDDVGYSIQASFFDMDNDNDLDAYIINRPDSFYLPIDQMVKRKSNPDEYSRDKLYRNQNGKFTEVGIESGITQNYGYGLSVMTADFDRDGNIDIYVSNDFAEKDYFYINQGGGIFKEQIREKMNHISLASMGSDAGDINNDGYEDLMVLEMKPEDYRREKVSMPPMDRDGFNAMVDRNMHKQYMHNNLHLNFGNNHFGEIAHFAGVSKTDWSWACLANDFDNDGYKDFFITNGFRRDLFDGDIQTMVISFAKRNRGKYQSGKELLSKEFEDFINLYDEVKLKNYFFRNKGDLSFENVSGEWGILENTFSNGAAVADFDNDGDLDLVINNLDDMAFLYRNNQKGQNYLKIKLEGPKENINGLGAKITLIYGDEQQFYENKTVRGYLSSSTSIAHFGLGNHDLIDTVKIEWTNGKINLLTKVKTNQVLSVNYRNSLNGSSNTLHRYNQIYTESTSDILKPAFVHRENKFDEYKTQMLLPHTFAHSGPFVSVGDFNNDGFEDFYIGGAKGQPGSLYQQQNGVFTKIASSVIDNDKEFEDMGSVFFDIDNDNDLDLYVVSGGSEYPEGDEMYQDRLYLNNGKGSFSKAKLPIITGNGSCVVSHDFDKDGDQDLFVGGNVSKGEYPKASKSFILVNEGGKLVDKTEAIAAEISGVGMVNSAAFTDINQDGNIELVIVGEWMPIKIFEYSKGNFVDVSQNYALSKTEGWWNKVIANDIDNDGDDDLLLGNLGNNYMFKASSDKPFEVFAYDFDHSGSNDIILSYYSGDRLVPVKGKESLSKQMPFINRKYQTFGEFAKADVPDILGPDAKAAIHKKAFMFESILLINNNGDLQKKELPKEAQLSTLNGAIIKDFDSDGIKDILITGNKFGTEVETTPLDASPGFYLKGKGGLEFSAFMPQKSGFFAPYNVKDMQLIDLKSSFGIMVASNDDSLRIYKIDKK